MAKEYAYIEVGATDLESSEAYTQDWINRVLSRSTLEPQAKALIHAKSMIPVEFSIYDDTDEDKLFPVIVETRPVPLWHILNDRFPWKVFTNKQQQTDTMHVEVLFPYFYGDVARELTFTRFFSAHIPSGRQTQVVQWQPFDLSITQRDLLGTEVLALTVWNTRNEMIAEIWFDVPLITLGANQWPRAISLAWPGMQIGVKSGTRFSYVDNSAQNSLWLKPFTDPVAQAFLGVYPRWALKEVEFPETRIEFNQLVHVTLGNLPGNTPSMTYKIHVPAAYRAEGMWQYYVCVYLNHQCPWLNCGVMSETGVIRPRRGEPNSYFLRSDASQATLDVQVLPQELLEWLEGAHLLQHLITPPKVWQKWDGLLKSTWSVELSTSYIQNLVQRCLEKTELPKNTQEQLRAETSFRYKYHVGYPMFSAGMNAYAPPTYRYFTFLEVLIGEPQRVASYQEVFADVHAAGERLPAEQVRALGGLRDSMAQLFATDIETLANNANYKQLFGETCDAMLKVRVARFLVDERIKDEALRDLAFRFLKGEIRPRLLMFNEKIVPNTAVLKLSAEKALLISLNMDELKYVIWQPSTETVPPTSDLMRFITAHLPYPEKSSLTRSDFYPQKKRYGDHYRRVPPQPVTFQEVANVNDKLHEVAIAELKQLVNYTLFTSEEELRRAKMGMLRATVRSLASLVTAAIGPLSGFGALLLSGGARMITNIADTNFTYLLAQSMDRPEDYAGYILECKFGALLSVVDLGTDIALARHKLRALIKQSTQASKALMPALRTREHVDPPIKMALSSASDWSLPTSSDLLGMQGRLEALYRTRGKLNELKGYSQDSTTAGYAESKRCADYLTGQSWEVRVIGVLVFAEPHDPLPKCHFAISVRNGGDSAILDVGLGNLDPTAKHLAYLGSLNDWEARLLQVPALNDKLVVYKVYAHFAQASHELNAFFQQGVSWGDFFNLGSYTVLASPERFFSAIEQQLSRLWNALSQELPWSDAPLPSVLENPLRSSDRAGILLQISNLRGFVSALENNLRRTLGATIVGSLRAQLLSSFQAWRHDWLSQYVALTDSIVVEEAELVRQALAHLEQLQAGISSPMASAENAVVDCVDWIALRAGQDDDVWRNTLHSEIQRYVSGDRESADLCLNAELDHLYQTLAANRQEHVHHVLGPEFQRLSMTTGLALFNIGLKLINTLAANRQSDSFFALIMTCQPYENSNEHFARVIYGIHALRQRRFKVLTQAHETRLSGLPPADPVPV